MKRVKNCSFKVMPNKERRKRVKDAELKIAAKNCRSITGYVR